MLPLFGERDTLYDAYLLDLAITNAPDEIKTDLEQNILYGQYRCFFEVLDDINEMKIAAADMVHKTFMGLIDMYRFADNQKALDIADKWADWFVKWTGSFDEEQLAKLADWESGGLMESWADLYVITGKEKYRTLMARYYRKNLFDPLIWGENALSFKHANTSIPEAHGCARAYEVTGEEKYRKAVEMFWHFAVGTRAQYATGGQSHREVWVDDLTENLSDRTQEFCTMYNMIRLADYLLRWTGEKKYADYIELCYYNGVLAQQNKLTGEICYFLPLCGGGKKKWEDRFNSFYCCCGTMTQAQASYGDKILYQSDNRLYLSQYIPFIAQEDGYNLSMDFHRSEEQDEGLIYEIEVDCAEEYVLCLRKPDWTQEYSLLINGISAAIEGADDWLKVPIRGKHTLMLQVQPRILPVKLGEKDNRVAFRYGPILLAALSDGEYALHGSVEEVIKQIDMSKLIFADPMERDSTYIENARGNFKLMPLYRITDERYQVYFPIIG